MLVFATNFKNENPYLAEWLEYHLHVGVDHFYLYDQDGSDEARRILAPYEKAGVVTRVPWTHLDGTRYDGPTRFYQINKNHLGFAHCAQHYRDNADWMMKIDVDEFLYPPAGDQDLVTWLQRIDTATTRGIRLPRYNFGHNDHREKPDQLVMEAYTRREETWSNHKDMAGCRYLSSNRFCNSAHRWHYKPFRVGRFLNLTDIDGLRINHYYTKSYEEYLHRQNVSRGRGRTVETFNARNSGCHAVEDNGMLRFAETVRKKLADRQQPDRNS